MHLVAVWPIHGARCDLVCLHCMNSYIERQKIMGTQNQDPNRQPLGNVGKKTPPKDPELNPERDGDTGNQIEQSTSDEGLGRDDSSEEIASEGTQTDWNGTVDSSGKTTGSGATSGDSSETTRHSER